MSIICNKISDIESRIVDVYMCSQSLEEASAQASLASYGWILLDSWVAWRTLRYLLRKTAFDDSIYKKWFQTPSSYTGNQLFAVWQFNNNVQEYVELQLGKSIKNLIDYEVQKKRNTAAHYNDEHPIQGSDYQRIIRIYNCLSVSFLLIELQCFLSDFTIKLQNEDYSNIVFSFDDMSIQVRELSSIISNYSLSSFISISFEDNNGFAYRIVIDKNGCSAGKGINFRSISTKNVFNDEGNPFLFFNDYGYICSVDYFYDSLMKII